MKKLIILIPCHNEAEGIAEVIRKLPIAQLKDNKIEASVLVIDNCSTDGTSEVARAAGARVIVEHQKGKGNAIRTGFRSLPKDTDYVVMIDGDDTYSLKEILRMVEPIHSKFCDVVIGSRLSGKMHGHSMTKFNRFGNWLFTNAVRNIYRANVTDVLTGYFAWSKKSIDQLLPHLVSNGFAIEMEMITKMARLGHQMYSVPISYSPRAGESNLSPLGDGARIMSMFARNLFWRPQSPTLLKEDA